MDWQEEYKKKLVTAEEAASVIKSGDRVAFPLDNSGGPVVTSEALAARLGELKEVEIEGCTPLIDFGATHEDAGFDEEATVEGRERLIHSLITMVPSLREAEVVLQTGCLRPVDADRLPIIGEVPGWNGVYLATGHWTKGILLSPVTAFMIRQLILTGVTSIPSSPFSIAGFNSSQA